jgi:cell wall-associated NlpC family hydrolase
MWVVSAGNGSMVSKAQEWISGGIIGLCLALGAYLILGTINSSLVSFENMPSVSNLQATNTGTSGTDPDGGDNVAGNGKGAGGPWSKTAEATKKLLQADPFKVNCVHDVNMDPSYKLGLIKAVANQIGSKMVYRWSSKNGLGGDNKRGDAVPAGKVSYDCSGFVRQVLWCAGFPSDPGENTEAMFGNADKITSCSSNNTGAKINNKALAPGDLVGWVNSGNDRHVLIYIGGGQVAESHATGTDGNANSYRTSDLCTYYNGKQGKPWKIKRMKA